MGISRFVFVLLILSIVVIFYEKEQVGIKLDDEEKPAISFYDSIVYQITKDGLQQVIKAKESYVYKKREELIKASIVSKNKNKNDISLVSGDYIVKIDDNIYIDGNVKLELPNSLEIFTEQLEYNLKTKIAKNSVNFNMIQNENTFKGKNLYADVVKRHIKANDTKMKIKVIDE